VTAAVDAVLPTEAYFEAARLERVFNGCFTHDFNTRLLGGHSEPLYLPPTATGGSGSLQYRDDYFASALHEVAHWCLTGADRRLQVDYGYWYAPDGRDLSQQQAFESVEYKPQALEWLFAGACLYPFKISLDNLSPDGEDIGNPLEFKQRIVTQAQLWQSRGLPSRGQCFFAALCREFRAGLSAEATLGSLALNLSELIE
jgi:elongation factor P hydroxylase